MLEFNQREYFTGITAIQESDGRRTILMFVNGAAVAAYTTVEAGWRHEANPERFKADASRPAQIRNLGLPAEELRIFRMFLELGEENTPSPRDLRAEEVEAQLHSLETAGGLILVQVICGDAYAYFVLSNEGGERDAVLISPDKHLTGMSVTHHFSTLGEQACQVIHIQCPQASDCAIEFALRSTFIELVQKILARYQDMAGRFLVVNLNEELNSLNSKHGRALYFSGTNLNHREFFSAAAQAGEVYRSLLARMQLEMSQVVGSLFAGKIMEEAVKQLSGQARGLAERYLRLEGVR